MRPIGFSTGALACADFRKGLAMTVAGGCEVVELSALRQLELFPLLDALDTLNLDSFSYISIHAPSQMEPEMEALLFSRLRDELHRQWPVIVHPDAIHHYADWREFGSLLCIENMDKRKPIGRTAAELECIFAKLPEASLCFDIGHARQVDPTMTEAYLILKNFGSKLRQVHVSEVNSRSTHDPLSRASILAFQEVAHLIPEHVPLVLETPVPENGMQTEVHKALEALSPRRRIKVA